MRGSCSVKSASLCATLITLLSHSPHRLRRIRSQCAATAGTGGGKFQAQRRAHRPRVGKFRSGNRIRCPQDSDRRVPPHHGRRPRRQLCRCCAASRTDSTSRFPGPACRQLARPQRAGQRMSPKPARPAVLTLDVEHFALQRQGKGNVGDIVEPQPCNRVLQRGDRHAGRLAAEDAMRRTYIGERCIGVDDVRQYDAHCPNSCPLRTTLTATVRQRSESPADRAPRYCSTRPRTASRFSSSRCDRV